MTVEGGRQVGDSGWGRAWMVGEMMVTRDFSRELH